MAATLLLFCCVYAPCCESAMSMFAASKDRQTLSRLLNDHKLAVDWRG